MMYILKCKELFFLEIRPNSLPVNEFEIQKLISIAENEINEIGECLFIDYLQEGQYLIDLWTAHILFKIFNNNQEIKDKCLEVIKKYCEYNPIVPELSFEEQKWFERLTK